MDGRRKRRPDRFITKVRLTENKTNPFPRETAWSPPTNENSATNTFAIAKENANIATTNWTNITATSSTMRTSAIWVVPVSLFVSRRLPNTLKVKMPALRA